MPMSGSWCGQWKQVWWRDKEKVNGVKKIHEQKLSISASGGDRPPRTLCTTYQFEKEEPEAAQALSKWLAKSTPQATMTQAPKARVAILPPFCASIWRISRVLPGQWWSPSMPHVKNYHCRFASFVSQMPNFSFELEHAILPSSTKEHNIIKIQWHGTQWDVSKIKLQSVS